MHSSPTLMNPVLSRFLFITAVTGSVAVGYSQGAFARTDLDTCGPNPIRCMSGYQPECVSSQWQCVPDSSSSSSTSECGSPSAILCLVGTLPQCHDGEWQCVPQPSPNPASSCDTSMVLCIEGTQAQCVDDQWECVPNEVIVSDLSPDAGRVGTRVVISGEGFLRTGNTVHFANSIMENVRSRRHGTRLVFRVPSQTTLPCLPLCKIAVQPYGPGKYDVSVENQNGISNSVTFTVTGPRSSSSSSSSSSVADCTCPAGQSWDGENCTDESMMCPMYYLEGGWCGCDGQVYGNSCIAAANGVKSGAPCNQ